MNDISVSQPRLVALGSIEESAALEASTRSLGVTFVEASGLAQLPPVPCQTDILLTDLSWLRTLSAADAAQLAAWAAGVAAWLVQTDAAAHPAEHAQWLRQGVTHVCRAGSGGESLTALIEDILDRRLGPALKVVAVDDDEIGLRVNQETLRAAGLQVWATQDPFQAMGLVSEVQPDVIVVDVEMPGLRGPELVTLLRQRPECERLPVIYVSAIDDVGSWIKVRETAPEDILVKPVDARLLLAAVRAQGYRYRAWRRIADRAVEMKKREWQRAEQLRRAIDAHAIVSIADLSGKIIEVNDRFCEISGYARDELLGRTHRIVKSDRHPPDFYRDLWRTIASGEIWHGEICNRHKDGHHYWVAATIMPVRDHHGNISHYISIRTDISRIKQQEEALRVRDERLRRSQIFANIGTWDWNIVTGELYWSERIAPLFGYPEGELETSYENFLKAVHPDDRQAVIDAVNACVERDVPYEIEHRVVWPDGQVRWLLERGAVTRDAEGRPLNMLGVVQDIDMRKRAELALKESERLLREAQRMARIGNWSANLVTGELYWSEEIYRIFGHEPGRFTPSIEAFRATVHPDDRDLVLESEKRAEETGRHDVIHRIVRPNGEIRYVHELAQMERDESGRPVRLTGTVQDVTERMLFEQQLVEAREAAEAANRAKSEFLSSMSHELRTPLNAVIGFAQMLEVDESLSADQRDSVQEIIKAGRHLLELINDVLDLAKIEAGRVNLSMEGVLIDGVIEESMQFVAPIAAKRAVAMSAEIGEGLNAFADRNRLRQVLLNLLSNAIKYNHPGGRVMVTARKAADRVRVEVRDTGPGIAADKLPLLFQPFNRLGKEASDIEGTGIGLSITRRLVELMGGSVGVESALGSGSVFWVELATASPLRGLDVVDGGRGGGPTDFACGQGATVLAIDDNPTNLKLLSQMVGRICPQVHLVTAHDAELGLKMVQIHRPDVILLDIGMPGMNGLEVLAILKAHTEFRRIPVVAVTAHAMPHDIKRGMAAGFSEYLTKPLDVNQLRETLRRYLSNHEKRGAE